MAHRRMISQDIIDTDNFAKMSQSARYLYYELLVRADDDGFLGAPMRIAGMVGCTESDLGELVSNAYIIKFANGIIVIRDWKMHNSVRRDIYKKTIYQDEFNQLCEVGKRYYLKNECDATHNVTESVTCDVTIGKDSIDKSSIDKNSINKGSINTICTELDEPAPCNSGILLPLIDGSFYDVPLDKLQQWQETFPAVDVVQEFKKMYMWLDGNPKKKKTRRGIGRFIYGWLERAQNSGRGHVGKEQFNNYAEDMKGWVNQNE